MIATIVELLINAAVDFAALWIGYLIIRNLKVYKGRKFFKYYILVVIGGFIIDYVGMILPRLLTGSFNYAVESNIQYALILGLTIGVLLFFYNSFLSKQFFKLENYQAAVIGLLMAILTNPVVYNMLLDFASGLLGNLIQV